MASKRETAKFIFIAGVEGSGTTYLLTLLSQPSFCVSLGGNYVKVPDEAEASLLAQAFADSNARLWDRKQSAQCHEKAKTDWRNVTNTILRSACYSDKTHFLFKRSFPFGSPRDQYTPDLLDCDTMFPDASIVIIYRDPCAATYSAFRRGFDDDLRRLAVTCCEQLTWLAGQVRALKSINTRIISYRQLCRDTIQTLKSLCDFCNIPFEPVREAALDLKMEGDPDARFLSELSKTDVKWLHIYFDERRQKQWDILRRSGSETSAG